MSSTTELKSSCFVFLHFFVFNQFMKHVCICVLRPNEDFFRHFGSVMLHRYGNVSEGLAESAAEAFAAGIKPTFHQFISYLVDPETERENIFNEHWRQV